MRTRERLSETVAVAKRPSDRIAGFSPEQVARFRAIGQDSELGYRVLLSGLYSETVRYLDSLARVASEGKNVSEAANFCRWLRFSGVFTLFEGYALSGQNFPSLDRKVTDLLQVCGEHFRGGRVDAKYAQSDIAEINRKLDVLLASSARPVASDKVISLEPRITISDEVCGA
jgi:hypothetical protein